MNEDGVEVLSRQACFDLLKTAPVGRVVFTDKALPAALPVNFALLDEDIVFRTATGSKLAAAMAKAVVAFEVDDFDPVLHAGWSVLVQGWSMLLTRPDDVGRARALGLEPWAAGERWHFVRIRSEIVSGRRLVPRLAMAQPRAPGAESRREPDRRRAVELGQTQVERDRAR